MENLQLNGYIRLWPYLITFFRDEKKKTNLDLNPKPVKFVQLHFKCLSEMQKAEKRLNLILKKLKNSNIKDNHVNELEIVKALCNIKKSCGNYVYLFHLSFILTVIGGLFALSGYVYTEEVRVFIVLNQGWWQSWFYLKKQ